MGRRDDRRRGDRHRTDAWATPICYFADKYQWLRLDEQVYSISFVPFTTRWVDGVWIAAAAMAVSLIATLYPARSATKIAPVESLRYE